jgi:hypothetical protein
MSGDKDVNRGDRLYEGKAKQVYAVKGAADQVIIHWGGVNPLGKKHEGMVVCFEFFVKRIILKKHSIPATSRPKLRQDNRFS